MSEESVNLTSLLTVLKRFCIVTNAGLIFRELFFIFIFYEREKMMKGLFCKFNRLTINLSRQKLKYKTFGQPQQLKSNFEAIKKRENLQEKSKNVGKFLTRYCFQGICNYFPEQRGNSAFLEMLVSDELLHATRHKFEVFKRFNEVTAALNL